ncbi:uncharacterized protein VTP21DRAFT_11329 [Calcarisporiella thermophila]|uniref:uncharacterized protein n=1 Tax=Calcarisporiella thermophila TaxID=911321 RepID=UPI003742DD55
MGVDWDYSPPYNLKMDDESAPFFVPVNVTLNSISIVSGVIVCALILAIRLYDAKLVDRVSLRLTAAISAVDSLRAAGLIYFTYTVAEGPLCDFSSWILIFLTNYYLLLTCAIAFNLQWVLIHQKPFTRSLEICYFVVTLLLALATSSIPWALSRLGYDENLGVCWYRSYNSIRTILWEWGTFLSWNIFGCLYCLIVVAWVIAKLEHNSRRLIKAGASSTHCSSANRPGGQSSAEERTKRAQRQLRKLVTRISLYALIPLVTQGGWYIQEIWFQTQHTFIPGLNWWCIVGTDIPGLFNLIAFLFDPALHNSIKTIRKDLIAKFGDDLHMMNDNMRHHSRREEPGRHKFARWFVRTFLGTKKIDHTGSTFYRMETSAGYSQHTVERATAHTLSSSLANLEADTEKAYFPGHYDFSEDIEIGPVPMLSIASHTASQQMRAQQESEDKRVERIARGL